MNKLVDVQDRNGELVVSSREVARNFDKEHKEVIYTIEGRRDSKGNIKNHGLIEQISEGGKSHVEKYFIESYYNSRGKAYKEYLLTRDGFALLAMGFTGKKALDWKLKYIEAFNKMEKQLEKQVLPNNLSPQLQLLINMELKQKELEAAVARTEKEVTNIKENIIVDYENWRKWANGRIKAIGAALGDYRRAYNEGYKELEQRANCNLERRLQNKVDRLKRAGVGKKKINNINYLDIIGEDKRLQEIYTAIVKEMCIKYL